MTSPTRTLTYPRDWPQFGPGDRVGRAYYRLRLCNCFSRTVRSLGHQLLFRLPLLVLLVELEDEVLEVAAGGVEPLLHHLRCGLRRAGLLTVEGHSTRGSTTSGATLLALLALSEVVNLLLVLLPLA